MRNKDYKWSAGYSLLEIMISIVIVSMMFGGGVAAYRQFDDRQSVVNAGRDLVVSLRETQKRAQSGERPSGCAVGDTLDGWNFDRLSPTQYRIVASCDGSVIASSAVVYDLPAGVQFGGGDFNVLFEVLNGRATITGLSGNPRLMSVQTAGGGLVYDISITGGGSINDEGVR